MNTNQIENTNNKIIFVIAHKYYRQFPSYIQFYIDNIQKFYPDALTIIADNNSTHIQDVKDKLINYKNVVILDNDIDCKFELGAYKVGINYIINNNLINNYEYCIFTQDTFVLKHKYNFDNFKKDNINAATIYYQEANLDREMCNVSYENILKKINLLHTIDKSTYCCCNSFILHTSKIQEFLNYTKNINVISKIDSRLSEKYLSNILYVLNNNKNSDLQGHSSTAEKSYPLFDKDVIYQDTPPNHYFVKHISHFYNKFKNENLKDNNLTQDEKLMSLRFKKY